MFNDEEAEPFYPSEVDIDNLAYSMSGYSAFLRKRITNFDKDYASDLPAGYTYLGQFIAHDISFDSNSDRFESSHHPWNQKITPLEKIKNKHTPYFDLETIYGHTNPEEGEPSTQELLKPGSNTLLRLGETGIIGTDLKSTSRSYPNDLPRKEGSVEANIVDMRNDENLLIAQTQVAFIKFHNAVVRELLRQGNLDNTDTFEKARRIVIRCYQRIVLDDYLPRIVPEKILKEITTKTLEGSDELHYKPSADNMFLPFEFTGAAFRFGHSIIRGSYNLNKLHKTDSVSLDRLMLFTGRGKMNSNILTTRLKLPSSWIINWYLFYDIAENRTSRFNLAAKINSEISQRLQMLVPSASAVTGNPLRERMNSISALDIFRCRALTLSSGQKIAERLGVKKIDKAEMGYILSTKKIDGISREESRQLMEQLEIVFSEKTPLWFYILAEAEIQTRGKQLGEVGGRIVAEVILRLIYESPLSVLKPDAKTEEDWLLKPDGTFNMPKMFKFIRDKSEEDFDELNPLG